MNRTITKLPLDAEKAGRNLTDRGKLGANEIFRRIKNGYLINFHASNANYIKLNNRFSERIQ